MEDKVKKYLEQMFEDYKKVEISFHKILGACRVMLDFDLITLKEYCDIIDKF